MQDFRKLRVWERSHKIALEIYKQTDQFPRSEIFGLTSQLRRSCTSVAANIAEGCGRGSDAEFKRFLIIAMGSASETEYHLLLARDLGYMDDRLYNQHNDELLEMKQMLNALINKLKITELPKPSAKS